MAVVMYCHDVKVSFYNLCHRKSYREKEHTPACDAASTTYQGRLYVPNVFKNVLVRIKSGRVCLLFRHKPCQSLP